MNTSRAQNRLLGMAARQIRGPIGKLKSCSEFLIEDAAGTLTPEQQTFVKVIYDSSDSMLRMINDLEMFSRIETGDLPLDPQPTDLVALVTQCFGPHAVIAEHKHIRLEFTHDHAIPEMLVDGPKMEQVLNNLVSNAIKFTNRFGVININAEENAENVLVTVSDNGVGIEPENVLKLFDISYVLSTTGTADEKGTGLGLFICKEFVEKHGGKIWVESAKGKGSDFKFTIPVSHPISSKQLL